MFSTAAEAVHFIPPSLLVASCSLLPALAPEVWQSGKPETVQPVTEAGPEEERQAQVLQKPTVELQSQEDAQRQADQELAESTSEKVEITEEQLPASMEEKLVLAEDGAEKDKAELFAVSEIREEAPGAHPISLPSTEANETSR